MLSNITPLVLTFNEAPNLRRTLNKLRWARKVLVVDSLSSDDTQRIARAFKNVVFAERQFDNHSAQWNFGLEGIQTEWVLSLDADYILTDRLIDEFAVLTPPPDVSAYFARFRYCVAGRALRGTLYPPRAVLFRRSKGDAKMVIPKSWFSDGAAKFLRGYLLHDDRKPLARWLESQRSYARLEADKLIELNGLNGSLADRIRRWVWPAAPAAFVYTLLAKGCLFDGWPGMFYTLQRTYAELLLSLEILDRRFEQRPSSSAGNPEA